MISGCTDKNVHTTGLSDHLLFDHYQFLFLGKKGLLLPRPQGTARVDAFSMQDHMLDGESQISDRQIVIRKSIRRMI